MDEFKLKKDDNSIDTKRTPFPIPELVIAVTLVPLFMLLVYAGIASYTLPSMGSFALGSIIGWVIAMMISKTMRN